MQRKLKQRSEAAETATKLQRVHHLKEMEKSKTGGVGLKGTWKKLKGKKKKQRNMTAPEISSQSIAEAVKKNQSLATVREDEGGKGKGAGIMAKWSKKDASTGETKISPKLLRKPAEHGGVANHRPESQSSNEEALTQSQVSLQLSQATEQLDSHRPRAQTTPSHVTLSPPKSAEIVLTEQFNLSQASGKVSNLSLSQSFTGEDQYSTQSSSDIPISTFDQDEGHFNRGYSSDHQLHEWPEGGTGDLDEEAYKKGSLKLYWEFGDMQHKLNLQRVKEFLKSSGENEPVDLNVLLDWEGWMLASKDIP